MSAVTLAVRVPSAPAEAAIVGAMLWLSERSTSVKAMVPLSARLPAGVAPSVTAPVTSDTATTGASLVPVIVTSICRVVPSAEATVISSCSVPPAPSACTAALALFSA